MDEWEEAVSGKSIQNFPLKIENPHSGVPFEIL